MNADISVYDVASPVMHVLHAYGGAEDTGQTWLLGLKVSIPHNISSLYPSFNPVTKRDSMHVQVASSASHPALTAPLLRVSWTLSLPYRSSDSCPTEEEVQKQSIRARCFGTFERSGSHQHVLLWYKYAELYAAESPRRSSGYSRHRAASLSRRVRGRFNAVCVIPKYDSRRWNSKLVSDEGSQACRRVQSTECCLCQTGRRSLVRRVGHRRRKCRLSGDGQVLATSGISRRNEATLYVAR